MSRASLASPLCTPAVGMAHQTPSWACSRAAAQMIGMLVAAAAAGRHPHPAAALLPPWMASRLAHEPRRHCRGHSTSHHQQRGPSLVSQSATQHVHVVQEDAGYITGWGRAVKHAVAPAPGHAVSNKPCVPCRACRFPCF